MRWTDHGNTIEAAEWLTNWGFDPSSLGVFDDNDYVVVSVIEGDDGMQGFLVEALSELGAEGENERSYRVKDLKDNIRLYEEFYIDGVMKFMRGGA